MKFCIKVRGVRKASGKKFTSYRTIEASKFVFAKELLKYELSEECKSLDFELIEEIPEKIRGLRVRNDKD